MEITKAFALLTDASKRHINFYAPHFRRSDLISKCLKQFHFCFLSHFCGNTFHCLWTYFSNNKTLDQKVEACRICYCWLYHFYFRVLSRRLVCYAVLFCKSLAYTFIRNISLLKFAATNGSYRALEFQLFGLITGLGDGWPWFFYFSLDLASFGVLFFYIHGVKLNVDHNSKY